MPHMYRLVCFLCLLALSNPHAQAQLAADCFSNPNPADLRFVDSVYNQLTTRERIGQMIFVAAGTLGAGETELVKLVKEQKIGGIIYLGGTASDFKKIGATLNEANANQVPLIYSLDAEPSLIRYKLKNVGTFIKTNELLNERMVDSAVALIDSMLYDVRVGINYAPVCDMTPDNVVIGHRSFGSDEQKVLLLSNAFVSKSLADGILPVVKHFPGHGFVQGDSHKQLVYIDGEMKELKVFSQMIQKGAPAVMVGHIAVKNNHFASEQPATCSRKIVTDLLRDSLGFQGLVFTDALNMGAVSSIDNAGFLAMQAGCDVILMPLNVVQVIESALKKAKEDEIFALQIEASVKKILLLKHLQGLI
ncbi:glycoside hydrolase family 3 protein [bacterium]|nr:glycoside hydrolase family 3 protein [bacterium]